MVQHLQRLSSNTDQFGLGPSLISSKENERPALLKPGFFVRASFRDRNGDETYARCPVKANSCPPKGGPKRSRGVSFQGHRGQARRAVKSRIQTSPAPPRRKSLLLAKAPPLASHRFGCAFPLAEAKASGRQSYVKLFFKDPETEPDGSLADARSA